MGFKIGQKVVCIDASKGASSGTIKLKLGDIYTIIGSTLDIVNKPCVMLHGLYPNSWKSSYRANRFRVLDEQFANDVEEMARLEFIEITKIQTWLRENNTKNT